jgi:hypothetical protein
MTLADLSSLGSFISALAVAGSLIYLGLQTHQAAKHTKALIAQNRTTRNMESQLRMGDTELTTAAIVGNGGTPTRENVQMYQFALICNAMFMSADETFHQHEQGLLDEHQFGTFDGSFTSAFRFRGIRDAWSNWKAIHPDSSPKFIEFMDDIVAKVPVATFDPAMGQRASQ